jgi:Ran GTPase-activating protein (RanGAP) involved in mRNA processing and transport
MSKTPQTDFTVLKQQLSENKLDALYLSKSVFQIKQIEELLAAIPENSKLKTISLFFFRAVDTTMPVLLTALKKCPDLTHLSLMSSNIGATWAITLAAALANHPSLKSLYLANNNITNVGAAALASALENHTSLVNLVLPGNRISDTGATKLASVLAKHTALKHLNLSNNTFGDVGASALAPALANLNSLQYLDLSKNAIGDIGIQGLFTTVNRLLTLKYCYLRQNPGFAQIAYATSEWICANNKAKAQVLALYRLDSDRSDNDQKPQANSVLKRFLARDGDHAIMGGRVLRFLLQPKSAVLPPPPAAASVNPEPDILELLLPPEIERGIYIRPFYEPRQ